MPSLRRAASSGAGRSISSNVVTGGGAGAAGAEGADGTVGAAAGSADRGAVAGPFLWCARRPWRERGERPPPEREPGSPGLREVTRIACFGAPGGRANGRKDRRPGRTG
ncbi:hypothetical protein GCM10009801_59290 [Streptomyces albiaxialis]|uniref:Uncharacterized protein n=1 Tax=Streptomyces albiaxialis TaxID=329523 RepID=A0ABP5I2X7_9ACTN